VLGKAANSENKSKSQTIMKTIARIVAEPFAVLTACTVCLVFSQAHAQTPEVRQPGNGTDPNEIKFSV
jgi:hypothetical protein